MSQERIEAAAKAEYAHEARVAKAEKALYEHREGGLSCYDHHPTPDRKIWCCVCGEHEILIDHREHMARAVVAALKGEQ